MAARRKLAVDVTAEDRAAARASVKASSRGTTSGGIGFLVLATFAGVVIAEEILPNTHILVRALVSAVVAAALAIPLLLSVSSFAQRRAIESDSIRMAKDRMMEGAAMRREFATRLTRALEMVDDEDSAYDVVQRAMRSLAPAAAIELLLADNSHAHLERVVVSSPDGEAPGCPVDSPDQCVAARRAQIQSFADSEDLDACPLLRDRPQGQCSAVCAPVAVMGRTVGVMHSTSPPGAALEDAQLQMLQVLANQAGNRLGMLRVMAETQVQAATDGLTGLMNRRSLENRVRTLRHEGVDFALVMADLDHFKDLNDSHGHEAGDRALRVFSETLRREVRAGDLACRYGGEEFAIVLPGADRHAAAEIVERIQEALRQATGRGETATFTASFGIACSADSDNLEDLVQRADGALYMAKDAGRDRLHVDGEAVPEGPTLRALGS